MSASDASSPTDRPSAAVPREPMVPLPGTGLSAAVAGVALLVGPGAAALALAGDRVTPEQAMLAGGVTLLSGLLGPAIWLTVRRLSLTPAMGLALSLSFVRTILAVLVAGMAAWLMRSGGGGFWTLVLIGAGCLFLAEKAAALAAAWPALGLGAEHGTHSTTRGTAGPIGPGRTVEMA